MARGQCGSSGTRGPLSAEPRCVVASKRCMQAVVACPFIAFTDQYAAALAGVVPVLGRPDTKAAVEKLQVIGVD